MYNSHPLRHLYKQIPSVSDSLKTIMDKYPVMTFGGPHLAGSITGEILYRELDPVFSRVLCDMQEEMKPFPDYYKKSLLDEYTKSKTPEMMPWPGATQMWEQSPSGQTMLHLTALENLVNKVKAYTIKYNAEKKLQEEKERLDKEKEQLEKEKEQRFTEQVEKFHREERARINAQRDYEKDLFKKNKKRSPEIQRRAVSIVKPMVKPMVKPIAKPLDKAISKLSSQVIELKHMIPHYFNLMKEEIQRDEINDYLKDIRKYDKYIQI
jgi:hypothetical protein